MWLNFQPHLTFYFLELAMSEYTFGKYEKYAKPQYKDVAMRALYVTMRDGVKIALDVWLPKGLPSNAKLPAIISQTRYWRAREYWLGLGWVDQFFISGILFFIKHGYAVILVDSRGTGASFGVNRQPWDSEEIKDQSEIVDWIIAQSWSNGRVGGYGTSYAGTTAELLTLSHHPAVCGVIPRFNEFDVYTDVAFPGGIYLQAFAEKWAESNWELDHNRIPQDWGFKGRLLRGVKPVDADRDRKMLRQAVREHESNIRIDDISSRITFRDDHALGISIEDSSVHTFRARIEQSGVPIYGWGGWFDAGTADAVIRRFMTLRNPQLAVVGPWNHGANQHASPYAPCPADTRSQGMEYLKFFDCHLKNVDNAVMAERVLNYFTIGKEKWKTTTTWPPAGSTRLRWYLAEKNLLARETPNDETGEDKYTIDFDATTGLSNRWHTQKGGGPVLYPDRAQQDQHLLLYTSEPLAEDIEITGYPIVTLFVTSTCTDGAFFVYLEDVDADGKIFYLIEGQFRALHRKISTEPPPYTQFVPYHSFKRQDALPLKPGEIAEITFGLLPISALIRQGHRIRLAIAGADKDTFARIPKEETPVITVARNKQHASFVDLPVIRK
jgi:putative CocE/NonD family hydrolase